MEIVEIIVEVFKYVIPAGLVLLAVKYMNDSQIEKEKLRQQEAIKQEILRVHIPLKISAYERAVLFLERISPENLLPRVNGSGKSVPQFHGELVSEIRNEFEHNLAQQIYISYNGWLSLIQAKEEVLGIVNKAAREMDEDEDGIELSKRIIDTLSKQKELPSHRAIFVLKSDMQKLFEG